MGVETKAGKKADRLPALKVKLVRHSPDQFICSLMNIWPPGELCFIVPIHIRIIYYGYILELRDNDMWLERLKRAGLDKCHYANGYWSFCSIIRKHGRKAFTSYLLSTAWTSFCLKKS
jgi:hypothetical protein